MEKIRHGIFETNSSSTHSISLSTGQIVENTIRLEDGKLVIYPGEFGWEVERYNDAATKASYALTYAVNGPSPYYHLEMLRNVLAKKVGPGIPILFEIVDNTESYSYKNGYIDHQSLDVANSVFENEETLYRFIFDKNTTLWTDNDNH